MLGEILFFPIKISVPLIIFQFFRHQTLRTPSNKLVINLAFSNSIMHGKSWVLIVNGISGGPILGKFGKLKNEYIFATDFTKYFYSESK